MRCAASKNTADGRRTGGPTVKFRSRQAAKPADLPPDNEQVEMIRGIATGVVELRATNPVPEARYGKWHKPAPTESRREQTQ